MAKQKEKEINEPTKEPVDEQPKVRFEERQPTMERKITLSKDRNWLIIKTIRTDIVHVNYMQKILQSGEMQ